LVLDRGLSIADMAAGASCGWRLTSSSNFYTRYLKPSQQRLGVRGCLGGNL
jgi:hypothetical protein